jgi:hypothetical protein
LVNGAAEDLSRGSAPLLKFAVRLFGRSVLDWMLNPTRGHAAGLRRGSLILTQCRASRQREDEQVVACARLHVTSAPVTS